MRNGYVLCALAALVLTSGTAQAAPETIQANIKKGDLSISNSLDFSHKSIEGGSGTSSFSLSNRNHYFIVDRFGLGGALGVFTTDGFALFTVGPSATYYLWTQEKLGLYFTQDVLFRVISGSSTVDANNFETISALGLNYFIIPAVAVGPAVEFFHRFGTSRLRTINEISFVAAFSIFL